MGHILDSPAEKGSPHLQPAAATVLSAGQHMPSGPAVFVGHQTGLATVGPDV
jgi:hypothetical protein